MISVLMFELRIKLREEIRKLEKIVLHSSIKPKKITIKIKSNTISPVKQTISHKKPNNHPINPNA